jgi:hypothetical protein
VHKGIFAIGMLMLQMSSSLSNAQAVKVLPETTNQLGGESASEKRTFKLYKPWAEQSLPLYNNGGRAASKRPAAKSVEPTPPDEFYWVRIKTDGNGRWDVESASFELLVDGKGGDLSTLLVTFVGSRYAFAKAFNDRSKAAAEAKRKSEASKL